MALFSHKLPPELRAEIFQHYFAHDYVLYHACRERMKELPEEEANQAYRLSEPFSIVRTIQDCSLAERRREIATHDEFRAACMEYNMVGWHPPAPLFRTHWIEVSLLVVSKATYVEAREALFTRNRIRAVVSHDPVHDGVGLMIAAPDTLPLIAEVRHLDIVAAFEGWTTDHDESQIIYLSPYSFFGAAFQIRAQNRRVKTLVVHVHIEWQRFLTAATDIREGKLTACGLHGIRSVEFTSVGRLEIVATDGFRMVFVNDTVVSLWQWLCDHAPALLADLKTRPDLGSEKAEAVYRVETESVDNSILEAYIRPSTLHNIPTFMIVDFWAWMICNWPEYAKCDVDSFEFWTHLLVMVDDPDGDQ